MIPFIPLQFASFKTTLTMEQAIAILGRSLPLKWEATNHGERVSFKYRVPHYLFHVKHWRTSEPAIAAIMVYARYYSDADGVRAKITIMPSILTMLFFIYCIGFVLLLPSADISFFRLMFFVSALFYLLAWWETIDTRNAIRSLFHDAIIE